HLELPVLQARHRHVAGAGIQGDAAGDIGHRDVPRPGIDVEHPFRPAGGDVPAHGVEVQLAIDGAGLDPAEAEVDQHPAAFGDGDPEIGRRLEAVAIAPDGDPAPPAFPVPPTILATPGAVLSNIEVGVGPPAHGGVDDP